MSAEKVNSEALLNILEDLEEEKQRLKESEEELNNTKNMYNNLLNHVTDLIQSVDKDGKFVHVNKAWKKVLGYSDKEIPSLTFADIIAKDQLKSCNQIFNKIKKGESFSDYQTAFLTKRGHKINVKGDISAIIKDGKFISTMGVFKVIPNNKQEQAYEKAIKKLFSKYNDMPSREELEEVFLGKKK